MPRLLFFFALILFFLFFMIACEQNSNSDDEYGCKDDDSDDDLDDDDSTTDPTEGVCPWSGELFNDGQLRIETVEGGEPGALGTAVGVKPDGTVLVAATQGNVLCLYPVDDDGLLSEGTLIAKYAAYPHMAIDSSGRLHLAYADTREDSVKYATDVSGAWSYSTVDEKAFVEDARGLGIVLAPDETARIALVNGTNGEIRYASPLATAWDLSVAAKSFPYVKMSFSMDSAGTAHIAYGSGDLSYVTNKTGQWVKEVVANGLIRNFSIVAETDSAVTILYTEGMELMEARKDGGAFSISTIGHLGGDESYFEDLVVASDGQGGVHGAFYGRYSYYDDDIKKEDDFKSEKTDVTFPDTGLYYIQRQADGLYQYKSSASEYNNTVINLAMAIGPDGQVHATYCDSHSKAPDVLRYGFGDLDHLSQSVLLENIWDDSRPVLALSPDGQPTFLYGKNESEMRLAQQIDGTWVMGNVPFEGSAELLERYMRSMVIDDQGFCHIGVSQYLNDTTYITGGHGGWSVAAIPNGLCTQDNDIAMDTDGNIGLTFLRCHSGPGQPMEHNLYLAFEQNGQWTSALLDGIGNTGYKPSLAFDGMGVAHIAYYGNGNLIYGNETGGTWSREVLARQVTGVGQALALDGAGAKHIVYVSGDGTLMHITDSSGQWVSESIGEIPSTDIERPSLAIASDGSVHIAYQYGGTDSSPGRIKCATNFSGQWAIMDIDEGEGATLKIDPQGTVHIGYACYGAVLHATLP